MATIILPSGGSVQLELVRDAQNAIIGLRLTTEAGVTRTVSYALLPAPDRPGDRVSVQEKLQVLADAWFGAGQVRVQVYSLEPPHVRVYGT